MQLKHIFLLIGAGRSSCSDNGTLRKSETATTGVDYKVRTMQRCNHAGGVSMSILMQVNTHSEKRKLAEQVRRSWRFTCPLEINDDLSHVFGIGTEVTLRVTEGSSVLQVSTPLVARFFSISLAVRQNY